MKTVGVVARHEDRRVVEIAEPFGVVAAVVPSTNPTSTAIYKILIALKARCAIVLSPHPAAVKCITRVAEVMDEAARRAGAPAGAINWMTTVTLEGTQELMKHRDVAVILATGGMGLVRAAYSAGKPAYGVGPGQRAGVHRAHRGRQEGRPRHHHRQDVRQRRPLLVGELGRRRRADRRGGQARVPGAGRLLHVDGRDGRAWRACSSRRSGCRIRRWSASPPPFIAEKCGITVPAETRVLIAPLEGVGPRLSRSRSRSSARSCPSTSSGTGARAASAASRSCATAGWATRCPSTRRTSRSSSSSASRSRRSASSSTRRRRIGSIGLTTGLDPAMTLGCGGYGGNITSDNISPRHLLNIKRLAYEITPGGRADSNAERPATSRRPAPPVPAGGHQRRGADAAESTSSWARAAIEADATGIRARPTPGAPRAVCAAAAAPSGVRVDGRRSTSSAKRTSGAAIQAGRKLVVSERAIVTPAARDLGEAAPGLSHRPVARSPAAVHNCRLLLSQLDLLLTSRVATVRMPQP